MAWTTRSWVPFPMPAVFIFAIATLVPPSSVYKAHRAISWPSVCLIHCFAVRTGLPSAVSWVFCWDRLGAARPAVLSVKASSSIPSAFPTPTCGCTTRAVVQCGVLPVPGAVRNYRHIVPVWLFLFRAPLVFIIIILIILERKAKGNKAYCAIPVLCLNYKVR